MAVCASSLPVDLRVVTAVGSIPTEDFILRKFSSNARLVVEAVDQRQQQQLDLTELSKMLEKPSCTTRKSVASALHCRTAVWAHGNTFPLLHFSFIFGTVFNQNDEVSRVEARGRAID